MQISSTARRGGWQPRPSRGGFFDFLYVILDIIATCMQNFKLIDRKKTENFSFENLLHCFWATLYILIILKHKVSCAMKYNFFSRSRLHPTRSTHPDPLQRGQPSKETKPSQTSEEENLELPPTEKHETKANSDIPADIPATAAAAACPEPAAPAATSQPAPDGRPAAVYGTFPGANA